MARDRRLDILAGIETGVVAGAVMLLSFVLIAPLIGHSWWLIPNLMASRVYHRGLLHPGAATVVGSAWLLVGAGIGGAVNGLLAPNGRVFGVGIAAAAYLFSWLFIWKRLAPLMLVHAPQSLVMAGFLVYGAVLGRHSWFRATLDH